LACVPADPMPSRSRSRSREGPGGEVIWNTYYSTEGHAYYHQKETNQTVWQRPEGPNVKVVDGSTALAAQTNTAPVTWFRCCTPQNQFYYNCPATGQTVWERPSGPNDHIMDHPAMPQQHQQAACQAMSPMGAYGAMPGCMPGMMPGMVPGMMPGMLPGMMPGMVPGGIPGFPMGGASAVEAFIAKNNVDSSAASKLRALGPEQQKMVMDRGDLQDARNPNAVLMGRIRDAERSAEIRASMPISADGASDIDQFIAENRIDASAGDRLRALPKDMQKTVMSRGNLTDARNPNAVLMARIRDAERGI